LLIGHPTRPTCSNNSPAFEYNTCDIRLTRKLCFRFLAGKTIGGEANEGTFEYRS
jgi:hypothetical protein